MSNDVEKATKPDNFVIFQTSSTILLSLLATENLGLGMKWKSWKPKKLLVTRNAEIISASISSMAWTSATNSRSIVASDKDNVVFDIRAIKISKISLDSKESKTQNVKREIGLHIKCKNSNNDDTYFRCIMPENEIAAFYDAIKQVSKVNNIDDIVDLHQQQEDGEFILNALPILASTQSVMRRAIASAMDLIEERHRRAGIINRRGAFEWLPVYFKNDLIHGSWWFVLGSALMVATSSTVLYNSYFNVDLLGSDDSILPVDAYRLTWALMIISSTFFTLGSLAFVRALHDDPPIKPLFSYYHLESDELLASWLFLLGTIPFIPYCMIYMGQEENKILYLLSVIISILMTVGTYLFVLASYPSNKSSSNQIILRAASCCIPSLKDSSNQPTNCCCISNLRAHIANDWLAGAWIIFFGTLMSFIGSVAFMFLYINRRNNLNIFIYASAFFQNLFFLLGSAYFVAGSYGTATLNDEGNSPMDIKSYFPNSPLRQPASSLLYKSTSRGSLSDLGSGGGHPFLYESLLAADADETITVNFDIKSSSSTISE